MITLLFAVRSNHQVQRVNLKIDTYIYTTYLGYDNSVAQFFVSTKVNMTVLKKRFIEACVIVLWFDKD